MNNMNDQEQAQEEEQQDDEMAQRESWFSDHDEWRFVDAVFKKVTEEDDEIEEVDTGTVEQKK